MSRNTYERTVLHLPAKLVEKGDNLFENGHFRQIESINTKHHGSSGSSLIFEFVDYFPACPVAHSPDCWVVVIAHL
jgi:hypothetical protein